MTKYIYLPLIIAAIFLLQIGGGGLFSVGAILTAFCFAHFILTRGQIDIKIAIIVFVCIFINTITYISENIFFDVIARSSRLFFVFLLILFAASGKQIFLIKSNSILKLVLFIEIILVGIVFLQYILLDTTYATYLFIPYEWYGATAGSADLDVRVTTIPSYWLEFGFDKGLQLGDNLKIRPTATYTEPSYFGFILLSFFSIQISLSNSKFSNLVYPFALVTIGLVLTESTSGFFLVFVYMIFYWRHSIIKNPVLMALMVLVLFVFIFFGSGGRIFSVFNILEEMSGFIRLVKPMLNMVQLYDDGNYFGVPQYIAATYFSDTYNGIPVGRGLDNGLLNFVLNFGILAPILIYVLYVGLPINIFILFLLFSVINGSPLGFDKCAVIYIIQIVADKNRYKFG